MKIAIGIAGASGVIYAKRLIEYLEKKCELFVVISKTAEHIFKSEIGCEFKEFIKTKDIKIYDNDDFFSPLASGSFIVDAYVILPCSMKTLSAVANGYADTLITRFADVAIKQKRKLIISPRETPFSAIHLENMLKLARLGTSIIPPIPAFYSNPSDINGVIDFVVGKILDEIGIENSLYLRWGD